MINEHEQPPVSEAERMANTGREITLKKLGRKVIVRELSLEAIIRCAKELAYLMAVIDFSKDMDTGAMLQVIFGEEATIKAIRRFAAESTEMKVEDWENVPPTDWLRFLIAAKAVNDWDELRSLFTEVGMTREMFQRQTQTSPSPASDLTPSPTNESLTQQPV